MPRLFRSAVLLGASSVAAALMLACGLPSDSPVPPPEPTPSPTPTITANPTPMSPAFPEPAPSPVPTAPPTAVPTVAPTAVLTVAPTASPIAVPVVPSNGVLTEISSGGWHTCGLREDGVAVCWGQDRSGQATPPQGEAFTAISSGDFSHVRLAGGTVAAVCWGDDYYGQASPLEGTSFISISSGGVHSCGVREDGAAVCWGDDEHGQASPPAWRDLHRHWQRRGPHLRAA